MYFQAHSDIDIALNYLGKTHMHTPPGFGIFKSAEKKKLCLVLQTLLCVALAYPTTKIRKSDETWKKQTILVSWPLSSWKKKGQEHIQLFSLTRGLNAQPEQARAKTAAGPKESSANILILEGTAEQEGESKLLTVTRPITLHFYTHTWERIWKQFPWCVQISSLSLEEKKLQLCLE